MVSLAAGETSGSLARLRIQITGQVQGVGFRPHAYRTATELGLIGWVRNGAEGVLIEVQGVAVAEFLPKLIACLPPLARVDTVQTASISLQFSEEPFRILESDLGSVRAILSPDSTVCSACLAELFDPNSRFYHYPFLNCTQCGPRLSIASALPYDRIRTAMHVFPFCDDCLQDYSSPANRRYHAQPTACMRCGPALSCNIEVVAKSILAGQIVALKGLGGYQLLCDASQEGVVSRLRERKKRPQKPFALMVANIKSAQHVVTLNALAESLLFSKARPIVLLPKNPKKNNLAAGIAPGLSHYGVMLPDTPLHYLLFFALAGSPKGEVDWNELETRPLLVTSGNDAGAPLVKTDEEAAEQLGKIADYIVSHNRKIVCRLDDSVVHSINGAPAWVRRARGFVPTVISLPYAIPSTLGVGGQLKNTFCLTRNDEAYVSQYIGSLNNQATIDFFHESLDYFTALLNIQPERIAHDLHPDFYTTQFAQSLGLPTYPIQHHHAHLAAVAAECHITGAVLGLALDGYGYGTDGLAWGGELLLLQGTQFERLGSFYPLLQPGGERAAREPWRMAASVLFALGRLDEIPIRFSAISDARFLPEILKKKINAPVTSSCGRLFDAASGLLGVNFFSQYEGQAAIELEHRVTHLDILAKGWQIEGGCLNMLPTLEYLLDQDPVTGANFFHGTLVAALTDWVVSAARDRSIDVILLSGGCFSNKILAEGLTKMLLEQGISSILPKCLPPNDGGISLGQAWLAGRM